MEWDRFYEMGWGAEALLSGNGHAPISPDDKKISKVA